MTKRTRARNKWTDTNCKQMTDLLFDYLNDRLSPAVKSLFQQHLRICPDCVNFLNTYKKTISATGSIRPEEIPPRVRNNVLEFLRGRVRKSARRS